MRNLQNEPIRPRKLGSRTHSTPNDPAKSSCFGFRDTHAFLRVIEKLFSRRKCLVCVQPRHHKGTHSVSVRRPYRTKKNPLRTQQAVSALRHGQQAGEAVSMATGREWKSEKWWIALPIATRTIDQYPLGLRGQGAGTSPGAVHTRAWAGVRGG